MYRRAVLGGEVARTLTGMIEDICTGYGWPLLAKEIQPDHVHLLLTIPPAISVADAVRILKGTTARKLLLQFPALKKHLGNGRLWSPSYYVGTAGNVSAETIRRYIERTAHIQGRR